MRAVVVGAGGRLEVVDKAAPEPGPDEAVVAVERCGICGSDLHLKSSGLLPPGAVMGHEMAGIVTAVGDQARPELVAGRRVSVLPARRCGTCAECTAGKSHLCSAQALTAIGLGLNDGAFAEYVRAPAGSCHLLPPHMGPEQGALVEPYAVALHAVRRSRAGSCDQLSVGVIGAGPIGLLCLVVLRRSGVGAVTVAEPTPARADAARALGATVVDDGRRLGRAAEAPLDVVFDAAGLVSTTAVAVEAVRRGGQVVLVGTPPPGQSVAVPGLLWVVKEVDVAPSMAYTDEEFELAVAEVGAGAADYDVLTPDVRPLEGAERSFRDLSGPHPPVKVMLAPER